MPSDKRAQGELHLTITAMDFNAGKTDEQKQENIDSDDEVDLPGNDNTTTSTSATTSTIAATSPTASPSQTWKVAKRRTNAKADVED